MLKHVLHTEDDVGSTQWQMQKETQRICRQSAEICRQEFDHSDFLLAVMGNGQTNTFPEHQLAGPVE